MMAANLSALLIKECGLHSPGSSAHDLLQRAAAMLVNYGLPAHSATPPAPGAGEMGELMEWIHREAIHGPDGYEWRRAAALLQQFSAPAPAGVAVAMEALARLYWWGGVTSSYGYSADVVLGVRDWIAGGMAGDLPPLSAWVADRCPPLPQAGERKS
jgi:hypothetical protein